MKTAIVTGNNGFIGKNFVEKYKTKFNIQGIEDSIFINDDWDDYLYALLDNIDPDVVFHIGACSDTTEQNVNYMMVRNYEFTKLLTDYCSHNDIPIIYSASAANYGINNKHPSNLYGWSKYVAEDYVIKSMGIALRYFNVYGPMEDHKGRMASVAFQMYMKFIQNEKVKLFPLKPTRDFVYIDDVIEAMILSYNHYEELRGKFYDVGTGVARPFEDVMNIMNIPFSYTKEDDIPIGYQHYTCSDPSKWIPMWKPAYMLEDGLKLYINYLSTKYEK